jgi:hypothetical protein
MGAKYEDEIDSNSILTHQISVGLVGIAVKFYENVFSGYVGSADFLFVTFKISVNVEVFLFSNIL